MNTSASRSRSLLGASIFAMLAYASASPIPVEPMLAIGLSLLGTLLGSQRIGMRLPRWVVGVGALGLLAWTLNHATIDGLDIHDFAGMILWVTTLKFFDRRTPGDDAQILSLTIFLSVASMLLSNGVAVAILSLLYLPYLIYAAMRLQLGLNHARAERLARKGVPKSFHPVCVLPVAGMHARGKLLWTATGALIGGFLFAILIFVIVPRGAGLPQIGRWGNPGVGRVVGFSDHMRVGMGGVISESNTPVLHLKLTDSQGKPIGGAGAIHYLRGAVLDTYEDGNWYPSAPPSRVSTPRALIKGEKVSFGGSGQFDSLYAHITILNTPSDTSYLFTIWRPTSIKFLDAGSITRKFGDKTAVRNGMGGKFSYVVRSSPYEPNIRRKQERLLTSFDSPIVHSVAADILKEHGIEPDPALRPPAEDTRIVHIFRQYFWNNYTYKLSTPPSPPGIDPIDWFLTQATEGHCEYYAASLAALCRSVGIPARVVTGYLAAEYNAPTGHYVVRESNAHAWIEAQTEPGIWRTVDGTPPADLLEIHGPTPGLLAKAGRVLDAFNYAWVNSVVTFDSSSRSTLLGWSDPATQSIQDQFNKVVNFTRLTPAAIRLRLGLRIIFSLVLGFLMGYGIITLMRKRRAARARRPVPMLDRIEDRFVRERIKAMPVYQEMLKVLSQAGLPKPIWQPPGAWSDSMLVDHTPIGEIVGELTALFYTLRFGSRDLDRSERARSQVLLRRLREVLAHSDNRSI